MPHSVASDLSALFANYPCRGLQTTMGYRQGVSLDSTYPGCDDVWYFTSLDGKAIMKGNDMPHFLDVMCQ